MNKYISILIFLIISFNSISQNVHIKGKAENQIGKLVRIIEYSDQFSHLEKTIAETITDEKGEFTLELEVESCNFAYLAIGLEKGEFYLSPNASYEFNIPSDTAANQGSIFDRLPLRFSLKASDGDVQDALEDFNADYNEFIYNNVSSIYRSKNKSVVVKFVADIKNKYGVNKSQYVVDYIEYSLASLLWLSKKQNNQSILTNYIITKPVLYNNIQYTDFFAEFFKSYFGSEKTFRYEDIVSILNSTNSVKMVQNLVSRDTIIAKDNKVGELVTMLLMSRYYFDRNVEKDKVVDKYNEIADNSEFKENRLVARNYIQKLQKLQSGTSAPYFSLINNHGDTIVIDDYKGKYVLLAFVKNNCKICEFHMENLNVIQQELSGKLNLITVVTGTNIIDLAKYADKRKFNWPILKTGDDILIIEDYNIKAYPSYILINPDGTIAYVHLPMPEENMDLYIERFMNKYEAEKNKN